MDLDKYPNKKKEISAKIILQLKTAKKEWIYHQNKKSSTMKKHIK